MECLCVFQWSQACTLVRHVRTIALGKLFISTGRIWNKRIWEIMCQSDLIVIGGRNSCFWAYLCRGNKVSHSMILLICLQCRTQSHNPQHASKFNHVCDQTKFNWGSWQSTSRTLHLQHFYSLSFWRCHPSDPNSQKFTSPSPFWVLL